MNLEKIYLEHDGRGSNKMDAYFPAYEAHFGRFVGGPVLFWEIGVHRGGSLQVWKKWFGPEAVIIGIDINRECMFEEDQIHIRTGHQADLNFLYQVCKEFGKPDMILDDGSHEPKDVLASFDFLYPLMSPNGVYCIEDLHVSYMDRMGGGLNRKGTSIEMAKTRVDELNADWVEDDEIEPTDFTRTTTSIHFYDGLVFFERGRHPKNKYVKSGSARG